MTDQYRVIQETDEREKNGQIISALTHQMQEFMFEAEREEPIDSSKDFKRPAFMIDDMANSYIDMKKSFEYVGDNSTFQKRITWIFVLQWIGFSYMVNSMAVLFRSPSFKCKIPLTDMWVPCYASEACKYLDSGYVKMDFDSPGKWLSSHQVSITEQFGLVCGQEGWISFSQSIFFLGGFLSGYLFSYLSSKFGKRSVLFLILIMTISSLLVCAFAPSFKVFLIGYFFIGFSMFGYETSVYIYIGEISAERFRTISINMLTMTWAGTPFFLPLFSLVPSWKYMFMLFAAVLVATLPFAYISFQESPRFLVSKKCYTQAREIFKKISITNKRPPYNFKLIEEIEFENEKYLKSSGLYENVNRVHEVTIENEKSIKNYFYSHLFKYKSLRKITFVLMYWWMFRYFMYFGLNLALESILHSGTVLTMVIAFSAIVEVIGSFGLSLMTTIMFKKYKLNVMKTVLIAISSCCIIMWFLKIKIECKILTEENYETCLPLLFMVGLVVAIKFFNTIFYSGLIVYSSEVYPTPVRSIGFGFATTFGRLGTIIVPFYINYMKVRYIERNSLSFLAPFGIIAFILCFFMPYTEETGMKETIEEEQQLNEMIEL